MTPKFSKQKIWSNHHQNACISRVLIFMTKIFNLHYYRLEYLRKNWGNSTNLIKFSYKFFKIVQNLNQSTASSSQPYFKSDYSLLSLSFCDNSIYFSISFKIILHCRTSTCWKSIAWWATVQGVTKSPIWLSN